MSILLPSEENITRLKVQPTKGEKHLLDSLKNLLSNDYEIYSQPFLNGDKPDFIIMRKNYRVMIIEVKDWDLESYYIDSNKKWRLKQNGAIIKSPIAQVQTYKDNLYNLHIENLLENKIDNQKFFGIVSCAVYFHNANQETLNNFLLNALSDNDNKYVKVFGNDSINIEKLRVILSEQGLYKPSPLFNDTIYNSFRRYLQPPLHTLEQGIITHFNSQQKKLVKSETTRTGRKIKGVAGSGKTQILAQRAVNAHKRTGSKVLILTYNITLKNYIYDKISDVREEFNWDNLYITNYHNFLTAEFNNLGIEIQLPRDFENLSNDKKSEYLENKYYSNEQVFEDVKEKIQKYQVILIDELQDYKVEWQRIIRKYFWDEGGEYVVFGDVKRNIYNRPLNEYKDFKAAGIYSQWNVFKESFRLTTNIANVACKFQRHFFDGKYEVDELIKINSQGSLFPLEEYFQYIYYDKLTYIGTIVDDIYSLIFQLNKHPNDICFLSPRIEILKDIDYLIRNHKHEKTQTIFETKEMYDKLHSQSKYLENDIKKLRENKKFNFWMNPGNVKLSTIHSFKGWEINTLFLIIEAGVTENSEHEISIDELVYTGLTRCRHNFIIINIGNSRYHSFFKELVENDFLKT
ncbi:NERD domain-containing protein [Nostoc sp.]|uniref:NERD domain-containing protein n=1 Tax=Nostoc sp. TaxID=1180 RepID=UPI002FF55422